MTVGGEEAAEMIATIRGDHVVMKQWFMGDSAEAKALREKWGDYPGLWKEVLNWKGWKEARKGYLAYQQTNRADNGSRNWRPEGENVPRKRKSRWGGTDPSSAGAQAPPSRRSRWSSNAPSSHPAPAPSSRPSLPGLPGMPANLPPRQRQEMEVLQARLREVNTRLQNVEQEAARVDALPVRERSPSPPPGMSQYYRNVFFYFYKIATAYISPFLFRLKFMALMANARILVQCDGENVYPENATNC